MLLPVLLGFLGLALDGGYYFAAGRAATFAASAGARGAAGEIVASRFSSASATGQAVGQVNLNTLKLSGVNVLIEYNDAVNPPAGATNWYTTAPSLNTHAVRATASGTYTTLFLQIVGLPTVNIQRVASVGFTGYTPGVMMPLAICRSVMDALDANPTTPVTLWQFNASICGISKWDGLVSLDGITGCAKYQNWILPQPSAPPPPVGSILTVNTQNCQNTDDWLRDSSYYANNLVQPVLVLDVIPGTTSGRVFCYRQLQLIVGDNIVQALPSGTASGCVKDYYNQ